MERLSFISGSSANEEEDEEEEEGEEEVLLVEKKNRSVKPIFFTNAVTYPILGG